MKMAHSKDFLIDSAWPWFISAFVIFSGVSALTHCSGTINTQTCKYVNPHMLACGLLKRTQKQAHTTKLFYSLDACSGMFFA